MSFRRVLIRALVHFSVFSFAALFYMLTLSSSWLSFAMLHNSNGVIHFLEFIHLGIKDPPQESTRILEGLCVL